MIKRLYQETMVEEVNAQIARREYDVVYGIPSSLIVVSGGGEINEQYCIDNNIEVKRNPNHGGAIVASAGDIQIGHFGEYGNEWGKNFITDLVEWLKGKGLNITYVDNDILVDGFKCIGWSVRPIYGVLYTAIQISINVNFEAIQNICLKPMKKIPKGLSEYGIRTAEVEQFLVDYVNEKGE